MKKTITAIAVLLAVLLGSCAETGGGEAQNSAQSSAEATVQTEAVTKDAETSALEDPNAVTTDMVVPSAELTDMDGISEAENCTVYDTDMDLDKELEGYAVYEATKDEYCQYYTGSVDSPEMPDKFAVRFTDVENFAFIVEAVADEYNPEYSSQYITTIYYGAVKIEQVKDMRYSGRYLDIRIAKDMVFIGMFEAILPGRTEEDNVCEYYGTYGYFISGDNAKYYMNEPFKTGYIIRFFADEKGEKITYRGYNPKYYLSFQSFFFVLDAFENEEDIDRITGELVIADGKINKTELARYTVAESYGPDSPTFGTKFNMYYDFYDVDTLKELVAIYNQYKEEGRTAEFAKE